MNQRTCDATRLSQFLGGDLSSHDELLLTGHLDQCTSCRDRLDELAADQASWTEAKELLCDVVDQVTCTKPASNSDSLPIEQVLAQLGPTDDPDSLGRIGGYEVTGVIGSGGMGVVLKAHDRSLDRVVAVKVMAPHLAASGSARQRFAREAKAAAAVLHPNVIAIHGVSNDQSLPYLVMPYVRGASLQKRIDAEGPLPTIDILRIGSQVAAGLAAAHEQGLVHRDIKPANILLEQGVERVAITDFGLARAVDDASMTRSGVIAGTPQYMSPEQARGEAIDARSDLFSLGSLLYAMCTGHSPFRAETSYGVLHRITHDAPRAIRELNPNIPEWLEKIVMKLLSKLRDDRFDSAEHVSELLEGCLAHLQRPTTTPLPKGVEQLSHSFASTQNSGSGRKRMRQLDYIGLAAFAIVFAGILIVLETNKGTLTIESDVDEVPIRIVQGDKVVERLTVTKSGNSVRVASGTYVVELETKHDGMVIENDRISLKRGATEHVSIRLSTRNANATPGLSNQPAMASTDSGDTFSAPDSEAKIIVDLYGGRDVLGQMNTSGPHKAKHVKLFQELNAIESVVVNFRESGPGNEIALVIVRDPSGLLNLDVLTIGKPSARRDAISLALDQISSVRWEEGWQTTIKSLQGVWDFISVESDGVVTEYRTVATQPLAAQMTIEGDTWSVKAGPGSGGQRVKIDGNKLTFYGMTTSMPGSGASIDVPTIGYGLFKLDGDSLVYLMTPATAGGELNGQSQQPIKFPETFETKGTQNNVFRLRRAGVSESAAGDVNSSSEIHDAYQALEKLLSNPKMDWKSTERYIASAVTRMTKDIEFAKYVLTQFKTACAGGETTHQARRHLLVVLTRVFRVWGLRSWSTNLASTRQPMLNDPIEEWPQVIQEIERTALEAVVSYGRKATRSDIVDFVRAARAMHHVDAQPFLRDVLLNPQTPNSGPYAPPVTVPTTSNQSIWRDNLGGTWPDARFVAAVGLAELGDRTAIDWLLAKARPNDFGLDESINLTCHLRDRSGSLRESSRCALTDLFGQPVDSTEVQLSDWWTRNSAEIIPREVVLKSDSESQNTVSNSANQPAEPK